MTIFHKFYTIYIYNKTLLLLRLNFSFCTENIHNMDFSLKILLIKLLKIITKKLLLNQLEIFPNTFTSVIMLLKHLRTHVTLWKFCSFYLYMHVLKSIPYVRKVILCKLKKSSLWPIDTRVMNHAEKGLWKIFEPYPKYFWIYLEKMVFFVLEKSAFDVELMTVSLKISSFFFFLKWSQFQFLSIKLLSFSKQNTCKMLQFLKRLKQFNFHCLFFKLHEGHILLLVYFILGVEKTLCKRPFEFILFILLWL